MAAFLARKGAPAAAGAAPSLPVQRTFADWFAKAQGETPGEQPGGTSRPKTFADWFAKAQSEKPPGASGQTAGTGGTGENAPAAKPERPAQVAKGSVEDYSFGVVGKNGIIGMLAKGGIVEFKINAVGSSVGGHQMFSQMMNHFGENAKGVRGVWGNKEDAPTNLNLGRVNELTARGTPLKDAVTQAWTAKEAAKYGFTNAKIELAKGTDGHYTKIHVLFTKP
jgi:hypothetical protein